MDLRLLAVDYPVQALHFDRESQMTPLVKSLNIIIYATLRVCSTSLLVIIYWFVREIIECEPIDGTTFRPFERQPMVTRVQILSHLFQASVSQRINSSIYSYTHAFHIYSLASCVRTSNDEIANTYGEQESYPHAYPAVRRHLFT